MGVPQFQWKNQQEVIVKFWSMFSLFNFNDRIYVNMNFFVCFDEYYHPLLTSPSKLEHLIWSCLHFLNFSGKISMGWQSNLEVCSASSISMIGYICEHEPYYLFWWVLSPLADFPFRTGAPYKEVLQFQ